MPRTRSSPKKSPPAAPRARRWSLPLVLFLALVFGLKLVVLAQLQSHPLLQPDGGLDTASYVRLARRVLGGELALGPGLYYLSPLYIYFLAGALWLSDSFTWVRLVQIALGTAAVACVFETAREWSGRRAAWIAAGLAALTGVFTFHEILILQASLDTFLTAAALLFLTKALVDLPPEGGSHGTAGGPVAGGPVAGRPVAGGLVASAFRRKDLLAGVFFGLQILNRPNIIVAVVGLTLSLLAIRRARVAALMAAGVLVALAPVVLRNAVVSRQFALVSSQGGLNLYIGNNEAATGQYVAVPGVRANIEGQSEDTRRVAEQAEGRPLTDAEVSSYFSGRALAWMRGHPAAAARLFVRKLALAFNASHQWLDFSYPYYARDTGSLLVLLFVGPWLLVPLGLTGLVVGAVYAPARPSAGRAEFLAWASFIPWYAVGLAVFFVAERYRLPILVPLCVAAGGAVEGITRLLVPDGSPAGSQRRQRALAAAAVVFLAGGVLTGWPFHLDDGRFEERLRLAKVLMNRGDYGTAVMELEKAHAIDPGHSVTEFNLGMAMVASGRGPEGIAHIRRAVERGVPIDGARYALASAMVTIGDTAAAAALMRTFTPDPRDGADSCYQVGLLALDAGAPEVADRYLTRALALRPGWAEAQQALDRARNR
jgi:4-amino-4-deoxy-L-arabinose transferase-like glycosyltransferase